jgi:DNA repair protein RadC
MTVDDRPRERMWRAGPQTIGDEELIAILLGTGVRAHSAREVAAEVVRSSGGVAAVSRATPRELAQVVGIGAARATRIVAAFELGRRAVEAEQHRESLAHAEDVFRILGPRLAGLQQEVFIVIGLDIRNGMLDIVEVGRGTVHGVEVHPREVFRPLIRMAAAGAVVVHNHPSGDPTPSAEDVELTRRLRSVGEILGIPIVDHVVVGDRRFTSISEWIGAGP